MNQSYIQCILRWCLTRLKRTVLFTSLLLVILFVVLLAFVTLNQDHVQLRGIKAHLTGGNGLGPELYDIWAMTHKKTVPAASIKHHVNSQPKQRPMVQFYPDNQNRLLYRKVEYWDSDAAYRHHEESPTAANQHSRISTKTVKDVTRSFISKMSVVSKHRHTKITPQRKKKTIART